MGNTFNLIQEVTKINRLIQEHKVSGKRLDVLSQTLQEFHNQMSQNTLEATLQFNGYNNGKVRDFAVTK